MARKSTTQLNIRSAAARDRVAMLAAQTGKTMTQVVEEAVSAYRPPPAVRSPAPDGFAWKGPFLIQLAPADQPMPTLEEHLAVIDDVREDRTRHILGEDVN